MDITAEGNALCAIGKSFNLGSDMHWPLDTICPTDANPITDASLTNSSGMPIWCTWPFLTCDPQSKAVDSFDSQYKGNYWWIQGGSTLPTAFGSLPNLQRLSLNSAGLVGTIPSSVFSNLNQLTFLSMPYNYFTGTIPSTINVPFVPQKGTVNQLNLYGNYLTGNIPSSIAKLQYMYLGNLNRQWSLSGNCFLTSPNPMIYNALNSQGHCLTPQSSGSLSLRHINCHIVLLLTFIASFVYFMYSQHRSLLRVKPCVRLPKHCPTLS